MPPEPRPSPPSPHASLRPRPTIADIPILPRRRLRDGSRGSVGSSSSGGSSATALNSSGSRKRTRTGSREVSQMPSQPSTRRTAVTRSVAAATQPRGASNTPIQISDSDEEEDSSQGSIIAISPEIGRGRGRSVNSARRASRNAHAGVVNGRASRNSSSSSTPNAQPSSSSPDSTYTRRFTAKEKGKGRAPPAVAIEISSDEEDGVVAVEKTEDSVLMDVKTRELAEVEEPGIDEDNALATGYACPICFNAPSPAILTPCGHILCAGCLHSALTAAIRRNPNPQPDPWAARGISAPRGGRGRGRGRGGAARGGRAHTTPKEPQPAHWTPDGLKETFMAYKKMSYDDTLRGQGLNAGDREAALACVMEDGGGDDMHLEPREVLAGLWNLGNKGWVVEGECPVCRNALPGGYGPPETGIGGITALQARLSIGKA
ncbi:hypothetical protein B9479_003062 [Cryptococcus floricola]|uniref:RING-type domain-containing protein n=1 Tax=Cryptococcus floricola TaxID=2591691 RepID=A0A5D3AZJ2_9TREE|nr:hypothetical protein B9479_003062 [Cryptococcus floricola]